MKRIKFFVLIPFILFLISFPLANTETTVEEPEIIEYRPVYIVSDNIHNKQYDINFMGDIADSLEKHGMNATVYCNPDPGAHNWVLLDENIPEDAVILEISYMCAGTLNSKGTTWYHQRLRNRSLVVVNVSPLDIRDLTWLPRAWDDNFSVPGFSGLENPYSHLKEYGIGYIYSSCPDEITEQVVNKDFVKEC